MAWECRVRAHRYAEYLLKLENDVGGFYTAGGSRMGTWFIIVAINAAITGVVGVVLVCIGVHAFCSES